MSRVKAIENEETGDTDNGEKVYYDPITCDPIKISDAEVVKVRRTKDSVMYYSLEALARIMLDKGQARDPITTNYVTSKVQRRISHYIIKNELLISIGKTFRVGIPLGLLSATYGDVLLAIESSKEYGNGIHDSVLNHDYLINDESIYTVDLKKKVECNRGHIKLTLGEVNKQHFVKLESYLKTIKDNAKAAALLSRIADLRRPKRLLSSESEDSDDSDDMVLNGALSFELLEQLLRSGVTNQIRQGNTVYHLMPPNIYIPPSNTTTRTTTHTTSNSTTTTNTRRVQPSQISDNVNSQPRTTNTISNNTTRRTASNNTITGQNNSTDATPSTLLLGKIARLARDNSGNCQSLSPTGLKLILNKLTDRDYNGMKHIQFHPNSVRVLDPRFTSLLVKLSFAETPLHDKHIELTTLYIRDMVSRHEPLFHLVDEHPDPKIISLIEHYIQLTFSG